MKTTLISCALLAIVLGSGFDAVCVAGTYEAPRVGQLREFDKFTFEGNTTFTPWDLWNNLNATFNFPYLSHPLAPRDVFLAAIESQLNLGYEHCGFPDARIAVHYDPQSDRVIVQIKEGTRYLCGPVEVIGARTVPKQSIVTALTTTNADPDVMLQPFQFLDNAPANRMADKKSNGSNGQNFLWIAGQPAHFDDTTLQFLSSVVTNTLAENGFFLCKFSLNVVSNAATKTATLQLKILDEGPPATIESIEVVGNKKNSREVLLDYLGLKPGMRFSSNLAATIENQLYHSARFVTNSVSAGTSDSSGRLTLTIQVVENDQCPPLNGKLEPNVKAMLKARDWLAKVGETQNEAVLSVSGYSDDASTLQCILAPRQGLLILENEVVSGTNRVRRALIISANQISLYIPATQQKFVAHFSTEQFKTFVNMETSAPGPDGNYVHLTFGAGISGINEATNAPPYALSISLAPAAFVRLADSTNSVCWFDGDQLILSNSASVLKLDSKTGRPIEWIAKSEPTNHALLRMDFEPDAFASALARIEHEGGGFVNAYRTNAPLASAVAFIGNELIHIKSVDSFLRTKLPAATCAQLPALLHQLETDDIFAPLNAFYDLHKTPDDLGAHFEIPEAQHPNLGEMFGADMSVWAQFVMMRGDEIFPVGSWPWTVARGLAFVMRGQTDYLTPDLREICSSKETGPIGSLVTAQLLQSQSSPLAKIMAANGLEHLSADDFRRDCRLFLDENKFCGRMVAVLALTLSNLDEHNLDALVEPMPAARADFIRDCARRLRAAKKNQPLFEVIAPALDAFWESELKLEITASLGKIAKE